MNSILARNILIHKQFETVSSVFSSMDIPVILLKGIALTELFPEYSAVRLMEDIDLLIRPYDMKRARAALVDLGYAPSPEDPWAYRKDGEQAYVDLSGGFWYMTERENAAVREAAAKHPVSRNVFIMPPDEFYLHVLAHAAIHHGVKDAKLKEDLGLLEKRFGIDPEAVLNGSAARYGLDGMLRAFLSDSERGMLRFLLNSEIPMKGHVLRFMSMRPPLKLSYLARALFPTKEFIASRYCLKSGGQVLAYRILRPFFLMGNLLRFAGRSFVTVLCH